MMNQTELKTANKSWFVIPFLLVLHSKARRRYASHSALYLNIASYLFIFFKGETACFSHSNYLNKVQSF